MTTPYITVAQVKNYLPSSYNGNDDAVLAAMIVSCSAFLDTYCNRANGGFLSQQYDELYSGPGDNIMFLNQTPVQSIQRIATIRLPTISIQNVDSDVSCRATVTINGTPSNPFNLSTQNQSTGLTCWKLKNNVVLTNQTFLWSAYPTVALLAAAINALGNSWSCTVQGGFGGWSTTDLRATQGSFGCRTTTAYLWIHWLEYSYYMNDQNTGEIFSEMGFPRGWGNLRINYTAGYTYFPDDLTGALCELVVNSYNSIGLNSNLQSQSLGPVSYSQFAKKGFDGLSIEASKTINRYRIRKVNAFGIS